MSPFLDPDVIACASHLTIDPDKTALREAATAVLPRELAFAEKTPRFCPDFDLNRFRNAAFEAALATRLQTRFHHTRRPGSNALGYACAVVPPTWRCLLMCAIAALFITIAQANHR
jgi:hypothetical protein